jgi:hypothetical protein
VCATSTPPTSVLDRLRANGRPERLRDWAASIRPGPGPALYVHHALLPHEPWLYLPSGRQSRPGGKDPVGAINRPIGFHDPDLTDHNHLRHLLQAGSVDRDLGVLLQRLRRTGLLDRAIVVVVADHGYSFEVGAPDRRQVTESNIAQIAPVPYFVKAPGQRDGRVDDRLVRTIDVLPTIADLAGVRIPWPHQGRSAFSAATRARTVVRIPRRDFSRVITISGDELARQRATLRQGWARLLGTGAESRLFFGDAWAQAYRIGPHPELIGQPASAGGAPLDVELLESGDYENVDPASGFVPTHIVAKVRGPDRHPRDIAVAVNGTIRATGNTFTLAVGYPGELVSVMVPESAFKKGRNEVEVLQLG